MPTFVESVIKKLSREQLEEIVKENITTQGFTATAIKTKSSSASPTPKSRSTKSTTTDDKPKRTRAPRGGADIVQKVLNAFTNGHGYDISDIVNATGCTKTQVAIALEKLLASDKIYAHGENRFAGDEGSTPYRRHLEYLISRTHP